MEKPLFKINSNENKKISLSFKSTDKDKKIYKFLTEEIKAKVGISTYIKDLIEKDMESQKYDNAKVKKVKKRKVKANSEKSNLIDCEFYEYPNVQNS